MLERVHGLLTDPRLREIQRAVYKPLAELEVDLLPSKEPLPFEEMRRSRHWHPAKRNEIWGRKLDCVWLHVRGIAPENPDTAVILLQNTGEALFYSAKGEPFASVSEVWVPHITVSAAGEARAVKFDDKCLSGGHIDFYIDCGYNGFMMTDTGYGRFTSAVLAECRMDVYSLYYDFLTVKQWSDSLGNNVEKEMLRLSLQKAWEAF